jgi:hypothetical protein
LGTGHRDLHHWRGHRRLPPMIRAKQKVYLHRQWSNWEIIRSKFFSKFYRACFFHIVSFELELTSYISYKGHLTKELFFCCYRYFYIKMNIHSRGTHVLVPISTHPNMQASPISWGYPFNSPLLLYKVCTEYYILPQGGMCWAAPIHVFFQASIIKN